MNDGTGDTKQVCVEGTQLYGAVRTENGLGYGNKDPQREIWLILDNAAHIYHFKNADAWKQVQPRYSLATLAGVEEEFRPLNTVELAELFSYARTEGIAAIPAKTRLALKIDDSSPLEKIYNYCASAAYVLTERGLLAGRGDFGNCLYVITPQMLAADDRRTQAYAEKDRLSAAQGQAYAAHLPGYDRLIRHFHVRQAKLADFWQGFSFSASLGCPAISMI